MSSDVTRRNFIKTTGAAVGIITTAGFNAGSFAANEKIRLGIIGTGKQGQIAHIGQGLTVNKDQIKIVATCDIWSYNREIGANLIDDTDLSVYVDYKEMVDKEELDAVLIATPLYTHYQIVMDCLDAGLYVFCEKTMTMTIE
ncbi:MAG: Gfo/Idh/MocA family oxidoreductase, partial [Candidatus Hydrogenedentota bacterium]